MKKRHFLAIATAIIPLIIGTPATASSDDHETSNTKTVIEFYNRALNDRNIDEAIEMYMGEQYIQHNPSVEDGPEGFRGGLKYFLDTLAPTAKFEIVRTIAQDDMVMLHVRMTQDEKPDTAIIDIFRLKDGKVVEHWDVIQEVPAEQAHQNTMF